MSDFKISGAYVEFGEKGLGKLKGDISGLKTHLQNSLGIGQLVGGVAGGNLVAGGVRSLFSGIASGLASVARQAVGGAAQFETYNEQWRTLLGNMGDAKRMMGRLAQFADVTPFQLDEVVVAAQRLQVFGGEALNTQDNLRLIGDAAAATGSSFQEVAFWVSRAYSMMQEGQPFGEAAMRLQELGIMSGKTRKEIEFLSKMFPGDTQAFKTLMDSFKPFAGGMERQSETLSGRASTMRDSWLRVTREVGTAFLPTLKKATISVTDFFNKLGGGGQWAKAAQKLGGTFERLLSTIDTTKLAQSLTDSITNVVGSGSVSEAMGKLGWMIGLNIGKAAGWAALEGAKDLAAGAGGVLQKVGPRGAAINQIMGAGLFRKPGGAQDRLQNNMPLAEHDPKLTDIGRAVEAANKNMDWMKENDPEYQRRKRAFANARGLGDDAMRAMQANMDQREGFLRLKFIEKFQDLEDKASVEDDLAAFGLTKDDLKKDKRKPEEQATMDRFKEGAVSRLMAQWKKNRDERPRFVGLEEMWKSIQVSAATPKQTVEQILNEMRLEEKEQGKTAKKVQAAVEKLAKGGLLKFAN